MVKKYRNEKGGREIIRTYDILLKKWGIVFEEIDVDTRYGKTHIIKAGDIKNPPLMLFHGVGDDSAMMWIKNAKDLAEKFRIYAVDTMGGPGKSVPNENYGKGFEQCLWIDDMLDSLELEKVNMAGVSNGAYLAQLYGAKRPNRVNKLVCMAGTLRKGDKPEGFFKLMSSMKVFFPEALFPTQKNMVKLIDKLSAGNSEVIKKDKNMMMHWEALLKHFNNMSMGFHKILPISEKEVENLKGNSLFIIGDKDPISYSLEAEKILKENDINYTIIKNAGHTVNYEMSDKINSLIKEFILG